MVPEKAEKSRIESFQEAGTEIRWPELSCQYLFDLLMSAGAYTNFGIGNVPLTWSDLEAWQRQQGLSLKPWELSIIRRASATYVQEMQTAVKPDAPPPGRVVEQDPNKTAQRIKSILR